MEMSPEVLGGMAYNPYSEKTDYGFVLRNALNNLLAVRQMQGERAREEEERLKAEAQQAFENAVKERELRVKEREKEPTIPASIIEAKALMESSPEQYPTLGAALNATLKIKPEKTTEQMEAEEEAKARGRRKGNPPRPTKPSAYEMKKADIKQAVASGAITQEQGMQSLLGISKERDDTYKGAAIRQANEKAVVDAWGDDVITKAKKKVNESFSIPPFNEMGYRLDMPIEYVIAQKNKTDGVGTEQDEIIIKKYDYIHQIFMEKILPNYRNFDSFRKDQSPFAVALKKSKYFDLSRLKDFFDVYSQYGAIEREKKKNATRTQGT